MPITLNASPDKSAKNPLNDGPTISVRAVATEASQCLAGLSNSQACRVVNFDHPLEAIKMFTCQSEGTVRVVL